MKPGCTCQPFSSFNTRHNCGQYRINVPMERKNTKQNRPTREKKREKRNALSIAVILKSYTRCQYKCRQIVPLLKASFLPITL